MLLAIFLVSVFALEAILRHDEVVERKLKKAPLPAQPEEAGAPNSDVRVLAQAINEHQPAKASQPPLIQPQVPASQPASEVSSLDSSLQEVSGR